MTDITREIAGKWLRRAVGRDDVDFRDGQWEALDGVLKGRRQLVVQRTGWGKSMIYFLAAKFLREQGRGMTLLVSPLLALMRNQVAAANRAGVRCFTINSTNLHEWDAIREKIFSDAADLLIVSPERLANDNFRETILEPVSNQIGLLVVDEAHCVSDWGHDFRPEYKRISRLLVHLPKSIPVLATTATATNRVISDIEAQLGGSVEVVRGDLMRPSLFLQNIRLPSQEARLAWLAETLKSRLSGSGIVYALTIRDAESVARWLRQNDISAYAYCGSVLPPADMDEELRQGLEERSEWKSAKAETAKVAAYRTFLEDMLLANRIKALVATSALSMGFDKPDLAFVIHYQRPKSVVDYYQQVGRAGRGIASAQGVLLKGEEDDQIAEFFIRNAFPEEKVVENVLKAIADEPRGLSISELRNRFNLKKGKIDQILKFVMSETPQPVVRDDVLKRYRATPYVASYRIPTETIAHLTQIRHDEVRTIDAYMETKGCLMDFLCETLESPARRKACGHCQNCCPDKALPVVANVALEQAAAGFLRKSIVINPRKQWADSTTASARFGGKFKIPPELQMDEGRALSLYGVGKWGHLVADGKYATQPPHFDDCLVEACAAMLKMFRDKRVVSYLVPVPSRRNNTLVGDFAERLARRIGLPCWRGLVKRIDTQPQKNMENSAFQQNNVINAFAVEGVVPRGGCFLVDDMVDSKWTFTVAAAVLRQAGADFVIPIALADSSNTGDE